MKYVIFLLFFVIVGCSGEQEFYGHWNGVVAGKKAEIVLFEDHKYIVISVEEGKQEDGVWVKAEDGSILFFNTREPEGMATIENGKLVLQAGEDRFEFEAGSAPKSDVATDNTATAPAVEKPRPRVSPH